ncbi:MAG: OprO/OprP family phosphate-selective porin [Bacteroidales bacterium]|jgi:phosphate-selective porin|nr:OprO/OprP family phosphate-selective porin [Bacteroidales bacterium]
MLLVGVFFIATPTLFCSAQVSDTLAEKVSKLENILSKLPKISGLINVRYQYTEDGSSLDIRRARLDVRGDATRWFDYRLQVEFASSPKILDAYIRAKIKPYFNIQIGEFKVPFSLENPYSPITLEAIDNAQVITRLVGYEDLSGIRANGRDIGLMFYGGVFKREGYHILEYNIGIFNGAGINVRDNNTSKDVIARIDVRPIKALTLSASGYIGEAYMNDSMKFETRNRAGFGLRYDDSKWLFRSECIYGLTSKTESMGTYAVLAYTFIKKLQPLLRFDYFQRDTKLTASRQINYTLGLNYWIIKRNVGLQVNYTHQTYMSSVKNSGLLSAMATFGF